MLAATVFGILCLKVFVPKSEKIKMNKNIIVSLVLFGGET
jgi:hypothetical protein